MYSVVLDELPDELDEAGWVEIEVILASNEPFVRPSIVQAAVWPTLSEERSAWLTWAWTSRSRGKSIVASAVELLTAPPRRTFQDSMVAPLGTQTKVEVVTSPVLLKPWAPCQSSSAVLVVEPKSPFTVPLK